MLYYLDKLTEKIKRRIYERLERGIFRIDGVSIGGVSDRDIEEWSEKSHSSMGTRSNETGLEKKNKPMIPDPWFDK